MYGQNSYISGSASSDPHNSCAHSLSNLASKQPPSHLLISSDDPDTNTELIVLHSKNMKLRFEVHHLQGQLAALLYVPGCFIFYIGHTLIIILKENHTVNSSMPLDKRLTELEKTSGIWSNRSQLSLLDQSLGPTNQIFPLIWTKMTLQLSNSGHQALGKKSRKLARPPTSTSLYLANGWKMSLVSPS